jgi:small subunit ribosomal protein S6
MPANVYECMFLLDTNKVAGDVKSASEQLHGLLERNGAEVLASRPWDERKLAYPIKGQKKGLYYLTYFRTEGQNVARIEQDCVLNETILRMLTTRIDPKLVDIMLRLAQDEHAFALPTVHEGGEGGEDLPGRVRRGSGESKEKPRPPQEDGKAPAEGSS